MRNSEKIIITERSVNELEKISNLIDRIECLIEIKNDYIHEITRTNSLSNERLLELLNFVQLATEEIEVVKNELKGFI